ncbi:1-hydroxycarotenoid 3,4-desaturase CrtD [Hugenholtzia roseola]|uniref:1-hydroxycarotenoid 3,4-desaturase CrtD n=1 Tax=Hugenholtzia roseola TaxID=1002 RepID=UPI0003FE8E0E|nr:1-hydroxycarotenoid 3,4-desaturase CrtD [Hugenholtzia roseola]
MNQEKKKALVIGAGIGGIAVSVRLALKGFEVEVFEANAYAGGKLSEFWLEGYRYDAGPSLFTLPENVEEIFLLAGRKPSDYFRYQALDPVTKYFWDDGTRLYAHAQKEKFADEVAQKLGEKKDTILKFLAESKIKNDLVGELFLKRSLHKSSTFLNRKALKAILKIHKLDAFRTMHQANFATFEKPKTVQIFNRYATYNGSSPYLAPATLNIIPDLEFGKGAYLPEGGLFSITKSLLQLGEELGVKYHFGSPVTQILLENNAKNKNRIKGIKVGEKTIAAEVVVSNMDIVQTYRKLLPHFPAPEALLEQPKSSSALIFYWNMNKKFPELDVHNIFFSNDYEKEFREIFKNKTIIDDPTVYIFISSKKIPTDAPAEGENWFVMINVPHNDGSQDWDTLIAKARENILQKLEKNMIEAVRPHLIAERILDPRSIEARTSSFGGALYGNSSNNRYAAFLRHANFSQTVQNLYFCGGSVHPGGGIPLVLSSAKIVADLVN